MELRNEDLDRREEDLDSDSSLFWRRRDVDTVVAVPKEDPDGILAVETSATRRSVDFRLWNAFNITTISAKAC
eukprot:scaffold1295_cov220-Pinguiococcus_pyrenoidosus.AAC.8